MRITAKLPNGPPTTGRPRILGSAPGARHPGWETGIVQGQMFWRGSDPLQGHEPGTMRHVIIISADAYNLSRSRLLPLQGFPPIHASGNKISPFFSTKPTPHPPETLDSPGYHESRKSPLRPQRPGGLFSFLCKGTFTMTPSNPDFSQITGKKPSSVA